MYLELSKESDEERLICEIIGHEWEQEHPFVAECKHCGVILYLTVNSKPEMWVWVDDKGKEWGVYTNIDITTRRKAKLFLR